MRNCFFLLLILAVVFGGVLQAQSSDERIQKLERICQQQEQQIKTLQDRLGIFQDESKKYTEKIVKEYLKEPAIQDDQTGITAGYDNGFFVRGAEGNLEFKFTGFIQSGLAIFENNTPSEDNTFFLNGVYLNFDFYLLKDWHARVQVNFAEPTMSFAYGSYDVKLKDAYIEYIGIPEFCVRVGQTHVPFSIEGQYGENEGLSIGGEPFTGWSHGRDIGAMVHGVINNIFGYKAGIFNGSGINNTNASDDMLMAAQARFYFCGYDNNPNSFFHVGFLRNREEDYSSVAMRTPWGRAFFGSSSTLATDYGLVEGWRSAVDVGVRFDRELEGGHYLRVETEFMYSTWQRKFSSSTYADARYTWLEGYGFLFGFNYRHCLDPDTQGSGLILGFKFSYSDIDDKNSNDPAPGNILGQRSWIYTIMLGYAFNKHISVAGNWVIVDLDEKDAYGGPKKYNNHYNGSGSLEQAWLFQVTAQW